MIVLKLTYVNYPVPLDCLRVTCWSSKLVQILPSNSRVVPVELEISDIFSDGSSGRGRSREELAWDELLDRFGCLDLYIGVDEFNAAAEVRRQFRWLRHGWFGSTGN